MATKKVTAKKIVKAAARGTREISLAEVWKHGSPKLAGALHEARRPAQCPGQGQEPDPPHGVTSQIRPPIPYKGSEVTAMATTWTVGWYDRNAAGGVTGGTMAPNVTGETPEAAATAAIAASPERAAVKDNRMRFWIMRPVDDAWPIVAGSRIVTYSAWIKDGRLSKVTGGRESSY